MVNPAGFSTPLQSLLGGFGIALSAHEFLILNGSVFGVSGFVNRAVRGNREAIASVAGLMASGALVASFDKAQSSTQLPLSVCKAILSGFLVGIGTKLANGCTSGHMICGLSRLSLRSAVATATFFTTALVTSNVIYSHGNALPEVVAADWTVFAAGLRSLTAQLVIMAVLGAGYRLVGNSSTAQLTSDRQDGFEKADGKSDSGASRSHSSENTYTLLRLATSFLTALQFGLALSLSGLNQSSRVLGFLLLPQRYILPRIPAFASLSTGAQFDPSLFFVAIPAVPTGILLYRFARRQGKKREQAKLGGAERWSIPPPNGEIDIQLIIGSAIFGLGWGTAGICPGPAIINFGTSVMTLNADLPSTVMWLGAMAAGGYLASS